MKVQVWNVYFIVCCKLFCHTLCSDIMNGALPGHKYVTSVCGLKKILLPEIRLSGVFTVVTFVTPVTV
jgi:hypothetical protein